MPAAHYRELARATGVHIFNDQDNVLYANASLICLHARSDGQHVLRFPTNVRLSDALSNKPIAAAVRDWRQDFRLGETRLLHWKAWREALQRFLIVLRFNLWS